MEPAEFGKYLEKLRKAKDLTQSQLAERLHVSNSAVSKWERGICLPEITKFEDMADILDVSLLELMRCGEISENRVITQASETVKDTIKISVNQTREKIIRVVLIVLVVLVAIWGLRIGYMYALKPASIDYGESAVHSEEDIRQAVNIARGDFQKMEGIKLLKLFYGGDKRSRQELEQLNRHPENDFTDCIVIESEFLPPLKHGGAWGSFHIYRWSYIVVQNWDGSWFLLTRGAG